MCFETSPSTRVAIAALLVFVFGSLISACDLLQTPVPLPRADLPPNQEITVRGVVLENDHGCEVDGWCLFRLDAGGEQVMVVYHFGWTPPCLNQGAGDVASGLELGDRVEVFGRVNEEGTFSTCGSDAYYVQILP